MLLTLLGHLLRVTEFRVQRHSQKEALRVASDSEARQAATLKIYTPFANDMRTP
jgi:hypothetical protein